MWSLFLSTIILMILILGPQVIRTQFKPFHACQVRPCYEQSLLTCALRDQPWAALLYNGRPVCVCCSDERDARIAAGSNVMSGKGLFWGNRLKVCETVYIDEITCQARQLRDCNYQTIVYKGTFVGCFYCRALCGTSADCRDLGRSCGLSKRYQPVRSCTFTPYAVADYDYDQGGLNGLGLNGGLGNSGGSGGLGIGSNGAGIGLGVLNNAGNGGGGLLGSESNNLLYIKENLNNFSTSFYMDEELRQQLTSMLQSAKVGPATLEARTANVEGNAPPLRISTESIETNLNADENLNVNHTTPTLVNVMTTTTNGQEQSNATFNQSNQLLMNSICGNSAQSTESSISATLDPIRNASTSLSNRTIANSKLLQTLVHRAND